MAKIKSCQEANEICVSGLGQTGQPPVDPGNISVASDPFSEPSEDDDSEETIAAPDDFEVRDFWTANWLIRRITESRQHAERVLAWAEREVKRTRQAEEGLLYRYGAQLRAWLVAELKRKAHGKRSTRSIDLPNGRVGFRTVPERLAILDEQVVIEWAATACPKATRPLLEHLYGVILTTPEFEAEVLKCRRNGASFEQARHRAMALAPSLYTVEFGGYFRHLLDTPDTPEHVILTTSRIEAVLQGCKFYYVDDLAGEKLRSWLANQRRDRTDFGNTTSNHYLRAMRGFATWLYAKIGREASSNPFLSVDFIRGEADLRRKRRIATDEEYARLFAAALAGPSVFGLSGEDREMLYRVAAAQGLRAGDCNSLYPENFSWAGDYLILKLRGGTTKNKKWTNLPVHPDLSQRLIPWLARKPPRHPLWPGNWKRRAAAMLRVDLKRAGVPYERAGEFMDFHAQRHSGITRGSAVLGVEHLRQFGRHGSLTTTMKYVHAAEEQELAAAIAKIPALPAPLSDAVPAPNPYDPESDPASVSIRLRLSPNVYLSRTQAVALEMIKALIPRGFTGLLSPVVAG